MTILANCEFVDLSKQPPDSPLIYKLKHFLKQAQQKNWQQSDRVFLVVHQDRIVGYARLVPQENSAFWLRGLYVDPHWRNQGIAANLIRSAENALAVTEGGQIICFALEHLERFYQRLEYQPLDELQLQNINPYLHTRFRQAKENGKSWLLLRKHLQDCYR
ncbi:GNAT family N-acetyltransferase [Thiomicrorhabdus xiamenensis]|uniref:GNAT family N-acetyltransferase n=1 Tax=Thiomicrorhabdus xiamenensis TaxID=2739063 RepID=A0A7D4SIH9_9GAMM|nr:GNAT family N-acetyltransferase [Thiomicrorhabdus xiamenensis]QKI88659.1 GNAT family N-acetyltransferase [Thiomicrorhabdus xiamenensis]